MFLRTMYDEFFMNFYFICRTNEKETCHQHKIYNSLADTLKSRMHNIEYLTVMPNAKNINMWVKKTIVELNLEKRKGRFSFTAPLFTFFLGIILPIYTDITGQVGGNLPRRTLTWTEIFNHLRHIISVAFYFALAVFVIQIFIKRGALFHETPNSKLCLKCGKVLPFSATKCECGGELDFLENYKWTE